MYLAFQSPLCFCPAGVACSSPTGAKAKGTSEGQKRLCWLLKLTTLFNGPATRKTNNGEKKTNKSQRKTGKGKKDS
jgi:hypothetical protein